MRAYLTCPLLAAALALNGQALKDLAAPRGLLMGTAVSATDLGDPAYASVLAQQYSQVQPENDMKWATIHPQPRLYSFAAGDAIVAFAAQHGMKVRGHTLTGDTQVPAWLSDPSLTPSMLSGILQDHITTVVKHYAGQVYAWDVLNEAFQENGLLRSGLWLDSPGIGASGTGYMELALTWAHAADPAAKLFYNDNDDSGLGITPKTDAIYRMAANFMARGIPLHGIGIQMHVTLGNLSIPGLAANIKRLTDLGLEVQITEMDIRLPVDGSGAASASDLAAQAQVYNAIVSTCLQFPKCTAVQTWGFTDRYSWIPTAFPGYGVALPMDANYQPKPAWSAMTNALTSIPMPYSPAPWFQISSSQFLSAASRATGPVAPGELLCFKAPAGPGNLVPAAAASGSYPTQLAGIQVTFDGVPAPIIAAANGFVLLVAPYEIAGRSSTAVQFLYLGDSSNVLNLAVAPSAPGLFTMDNSGGGAGLILDKNLAPVATSNPARAGDLVFITITGEGAHTPAGITGLGQPYMATTPLQPVSVAIGGLSALAAIIWNGPAGIPGMTQIGVFVPFGLPAGSAAVVVNAGKAASQTGITMAIQ